MYVHHMRKRPLLPSVKIPNAFPLPPRLPIQASVLWWLWIGILDTTMEFVVWVLMRFFEKKRTEAFEIMMSIHTAGRGVAGRYVRDIAESKVALVTEEARKRGFPLKCVVEGE